MYVPFTLRSLYFCVYTGKLCGVALLNAGFMCFADELLYNLARLSVFSAAFAEWF